MADGEQMPKLNITQDKGLLDPKVLDYIKIAEEQNRKRIHKLQRIRRSNLLTGIGLGLGVLSIYGYSLLSVGQETFLDDFDPPAVKVETE